MTERGYDVKGHSKREEKWVQGDKVCRVIEVKYYCSVEHKLEYDFEVEY